MDRLHTKVDNTSLWKSANTFGGLCGHVGRILTYKSHIHHAMHNDVNALQSMVWKTYETVIKHVRCMTCFPILITYNH